MTKTESLVRDLIHAAWADGYGEQPDFEDELAFGEKLKNAERALLNHLQPAVEPLGVPVEPREPGPRYLPEDRARVVREIKERAARITPYAAAPEEKTVTHPCGCVERQGPWGWTRDWCPVCLSQHFGLKSEKQP